jgi:hypothetical protein
MSFSTYTYFYKQIHYSLVLKFSLLPLRDKFCNSELRMTQTSLKIHKIFTAKYNTKDLDPGLRSKYFANGGSVSVYNVYEPATLITEKM